LCLGSDVLQKLYAIVGVAHKHMIFFNTVEEATTLMAASNQELQK
jgi:hypothetical protein